MTEKGGDETVFKVKDALEGMELCNVLIDRDEIEGGANWALTLNEMVSKCHIMIPIISELFAVLRPVGAYNAGQSWTLREVLAADRAGKTIIPLFHSGEYPPQNLGIVLGATQYIDIRGHAFDEGMKLLRVLIERMAEEVQQAAPPETPIVPEHAGRFAVQTSVLRKLAEEKMDHQSGSKVEPSPPQHHLAPTPVSQPTPVSHPPSQLGSKSRCICGNELMPDSIFCGNCGRQAVDTCACGTIFKPEAQFCCMCGAPRPEAAAVANYSLSCWCGAAAGAAAAGVVLPLVYCWRRC